MEIHAFNHSLATFCQFTTLGYKFFRNTKNPPPMKIMRNLSAFAALCQRIAMNSLILVILAQKGKLKSQDFIHRNDFSDSALQTFRLSPKERIKSYALTALQFRSIVLPAVPSNRYRTYPYRHADTNRRIVQILSPYLPSPDSRGQNSRYCRRQDR
jgi:hypothetical protein